MNLSEPVEVSIMFDPKLVDGENLRDLLSDTGLVNSDLADLSFHEVSGEHYYDLKNLGVLESSGEIIVFADSDIDPEENWIRSLVHFLDRNKDLGMVGGFTYIKPTNLVSKAFSAGWFFPLKPDTNIVNIPATFLWANNCAYRRDAFLAHPYRTTSYNETRGACNRQLAEMKNAGVKTANISSAVVTHPAPNGFRHFFIRGLAEGRDYTIELLTANEGRPDMSNYLHRLLRNFAGKMKKTVANSVFERERLNSRLFEAPILISVMLSYYCLFTVGSIWTFVAPESTKNLWRI